MPASEDLDSAGGGALHEPFVLEVVLHAGEVEGCGRGGNPQRSSPTGRSALRGVATKASRLALCGRQLEVLLCRPAVARAAVLGELECESLTHTQRGALRAALTRAAPGRAHAPAWTAAALRGEHGFIISESARADSDGVDFEGDGDAEGFNFVRSVSRSQLQRALARVDLGEHAEAEEDPEGGPEPLHPLMARGDPLAAETLDELAELATEMLVASGVHTALGVGRAELERYARLCSVGYNAAVPFHNFRHGVSVTQTAATIAAMGGLAERVPPLECAALHVSALGHDMGHIGLDNTFLKNTHSPRWKTPRDPVFGDGALEAMHYERMATAMRESGLLRRLGDDDARAFVRSCKDIVAATDMQQHASRLAAPSAAREGALAAGYASEWEDASYRAAVLALAMKCADVGAEVRGDRATLSWVELLLSECAQQYYAESILGLPHNFITKFAEDHEKYDDGGLGGVPKMQQDWLKGVTAPMFDELVVAMPGTQHMRQGVQRAQRLWTRLERDASLVDAASG